jgi:hypothetical protein
MILHYHLTDYIFISICILAVVGIIAAVRQASRH